MKQQFLQFRKRNLLVLKNENPGKEWEFVFR